MISVITQRRMCLSYQGPFQWERKRKPNNEYKDFPKIPFFSEDKMRKSRDNETEVNQRINI